MAMLVSLTSFAAALGEGYSKVTDITTLSAGDKVVLYSDDAELGITGWDGNKTATAAAEGWVEYVVEAAEGGVLLKDGDKYVDLTAKNSFHYTATGGVCKVTADGILYITLSGSDYLLYENANNGSPLYRMYVDKSSNSSYKPFYVYEVVVAEEGGEGEGEGETATVPTNEELWEAFKPYYKTFYSEERADQPITAVATFMTKGELIFTDATSEYKWLGDYLVKVATEQGYTINSEALWRWHADAFFQANQHTSWPKSADFTEAGKPENWGPYYLAAQGGTTPEPEPTTETVYFVNAENWTGTMTCHLWGGTAAGTEWPGLPATKEADQLAGYDVYSYTAEPGAYANVIFTNKTDGDKQTVDLVWTAGKYYVLDGWYTKEEAEAKLATPAPKPTETWTVAGSPIFGANWDPSYTANDMAVQADGTYKWEKTELELAAGAKIEFKVVKNHAWGEEYPSQNYVINITESGIYTITITFNATTKEVAAVATKTAGSDIVVNYEYVLMGVKGDWTTGIAMTANPDNANEYVLLQQEILEGDAVKVVTLTDGTATAYCGNVDEWSVAHEFDADGNIVLAPGKYDFYYKVAEDLIYIGGEAYPTEPEYALEETVEISNLTTETLTVGEATYLQLTGRNDMLDSDVQLFLNNYTGEDKEYEVNAENSLMTFGGIELTVVEGTIAQATDEEKGKVYTGRVIASAEEEGEVMLVALDLVMYSTPAVEVMVSGATARVDEETGALVLNAEWTYEGVTYPVFVSVAGYEDVEFKEYEGAQISELQIGSDETETSPWLDFAVANAVAVFKDGQNISIEGEYTSWATGAKYALMIDGAFPAVEEPEVEKPEPTYTDNNLNPYAFGLTSKLSEDKSTLIVNYRLNNSKATKADVIVYNGQDTIVIVGGTTNLGKNTVEISTEGFPTGVDITWAVIVNGTSVAAPTREEKIYSFYHPSGLDIDINPENETFGMLLVNEGMHSVKDKTEGYVSAQFGAGIFAFTPSFDLVANGDKPGYNGGIEFTNTRADGTGTAYSPRRIRISEDGRIFVTSLNTDGNYLWEVNADNLNEWTPVFKGTLNDQRELITEDSAFIAAPNNGFDVKGSGENLQLAMYSVNLSGITAAAMGGFRLHEYNLGTATEWATAPSKALVEGKYAINYTGTQVEYDNEGGFWIASYRGSATDANPGLVHINAEGVEDAKLVWNNVRQAGIRFNKDFTKLVVAGNNGAAKKATIYAISKDANGAPVLTEETVVDMSVVGSNLNDFAWDYAGNLYSCGNSSEKLAAWAMPYSGEVVTPAASKYAFQLEGTASEYEVYEDAITNLVIDYDNMLLIGGPSTNFQVEVVLGLGDYDRNTDNFALLPESSISVLGSEATFIDGIASVDGIAQTALAVVHCMWNGMALEFHLTMSAAPLEATVVVVENAAIEIEKYLLWGDMYDYALKMTGVWNNEEDGLDYPVLVEVPVYYPEATEPYEMYSTVTVGGMGDEDPWLGFGEGYLTITQEGDKITAAGIVENASAGIAIDITISGTITPTGLENATVTVKSVKMIKNGQLVIEKDGVQYNAQGAVVK